jgi:hypothetical protein
MLCGNAVLLFYLLVAHFDFLFFAEKVLRIVTISSSALHSDPCFCQRHLRRGLVG